MRETSPWYFIVSEPYWKNLKNVTADTTETLKVAYGVERSKAKSFREKAGVSTTDEEATKKKVEASGGKKDVWSIGGEYSKTTKQSSTYTTEFETFVSTTDTEKTGTETTITVSFPRLPAGAVQWSYWQEFAKIVCYGYNSNGEVKVSGDILDYGNDDRVRLQIKTDGSLDTEGHK